MALRGQWVPTCFGWTPVESESRRRTPASPSPRSLKRPERCGDSWAKTRRRWEAKQRSLGGGEFALVSLLCGLIRCFSCVLNDGVEVAASHAEPMENLQLQSPLHSFIMSFSSLFSCPDLYLLRRFYIYHFILGRVFPMQSSSSVKSKLF